MVEKDGSGYHFAFKQNVGIMNRGPLFGLGHTGHVPC